jgi:hypothetical protein
MKMWSLGDHPISSNGEGYKPHLKQERSVMPLSAEAFRKSLEGCGDTSPRGMVARNRIRLTAFPPFSKLINTYIKKRNTAKIGA